MLCLVCPQPSSPRPAGGQVVTAGWSHCLGFCSHGPAGFSLPPEAKPDQWRGGCWLRTRTSFPMIRGVTLRGHEPLSLEYASRVKRPLVRDTITSRCVSGEEFLENLGGPGVLMLLRNSVRQAAWTTQSQWAASKRSFMQTAEQTAALAPGRGPAWSAIHGMSSRQEVCVRSPAVWVQLLWEAGGDPGGESCHGGNSEPFPRPRRKLQMLLIEPSPPPSSSLWESAVGQVSK